MKDVTAAIIERDGRIFIARRAPQENFAGFWEFPGGKVEPGETPEDCLIRELQEEFGIRAAVRAFVGENVHAYESGSIRLLAYEVDIIEGEISLSVHDAFDWVEPPALPDHGLLPADIPIARKLMEAIVSGNCRPGGIAPDGYGL